jgi:glycosyltransferase involved in cell wall biosynthesis
VANLRPQKDHETLLRAVAIAARTHPGLHLSVIGAATDGAYAATLRGLVAELGLAANVTFCGARRDVDALLAASDVGVLSSASEGLPLALLEYGRAGLPVVVTDVGQCREVVDDGRAGLLVPGGSAERFAEALILLLDNAHLRTQLGTALCERVSRAYSARAAIDQLCRIYDEVIGRTSFGPHADRSIARA